MGEVRARELGPKLADFNAKVSVALNALAEQADRLQGRMVGVETDQRALAEGAQGAVRTIVTNARAEFEAHGAAVAILRAEVADEILKTRVFLDETRQGLEALYTACQGEFAAIQGSVADVNMKSCFDMVIEVVDKKLDSAKLATAYDVKTVAERLERSIRERLPEAAAGATAATAPEWQAGPRGGWTKPWDQIPPHWRTDHQAGQSVPWGKPYWQAGSSWGANGRGQDEPWGATSLAD